MKKTKILAIEPDLVEKERLDRELSSMNDFMRNSPIKAPWDD
jgi:hypothetical protein